MRITFLGTGTSHGVPMIGCDCPVCSSRDPRNHRTRCALYVECGNADLHPHKNNPHGGAKLLIDTPPELRIQLLRERIDRVDAIIFTHAHADHIFGLDDVRRFNEITGLPMPCFGSVQTLKTLRRAFEYVFVPTQIGGGKPQLDLIPIDGPFEVNRVKIVPIPVLHGNVPVLGFRIGNLAYVTDCSHIPPSSMELLTGLEVLVLGTLRPEPHETHFSLAEGLALIDLLKPKRAYLTHISHRLDHNSTNSALLPGVELAYDGLQVDL